jgi:FkbM family methyltransferase
MKVVDGWTCPDLLSGPGNYLRRCAHLDVAFPFVERWDCCIQAGGHVGTVPVTLAGRFGQVYTFEPDAHNFAALVANAYQREPDRIWCARGILGNKRRQVAMKTSAKSTGQHQVRAGDEGATPTFRIDDLAIERVGAIFLDVEGFEIAALQGAVDTLNKWRPVVVAEENKRALDFGHRIGDLQAFMEKQDYRRVAGLADDHVFAPLP